MVQNLFDLVRNIKGCKIATIKYVAEVKMPKKYGIIGLVEKIVAKQVQLNYSYENAVNNRIERQGGERTFMAQSLPWGEWEIPNKVITHKGERYLRTYSIDNGSAYTAEYFVNGIAATDAELATIREYEKSKNKVSETQAEQGLTEKQVKPSAVKIANILELKVNGEIYQKAESAVA